MSHDQHDVIEKWERRWLALSGLVSLIFIIFIAYSLAVEGAHIAQSSGRTSPDKLLKASSFANPGVQQVGENAFQVTAVAQMFSFNPPEVRLPAGADVMFFLTSRDILHGYQIENTTVNVEVIPGEVSFLRYTFDKEGEYRVTCNEYCGLSHQNMLGKIVVLSPEAFAAEQEPADEDTADADPEAAQRKLGESVYLGNCAACHQANGQGVPGAFPQLEEHTAELYNAEGGPEYLRDVLLYGISGAIEVQGQNYNGAMPAWKHLSDEQLAAVGSYIISAWGNDGLLEDAKPYDAAQFKSQRSADLTSNQVYNLRQTLGLP